MKVFAVGTLKRGFPLHDGLAGAQFCGEYRTADRFPMLIAGPWYAPMILNEPGVGHQLLGELYEVDEVCLARLDRMESVGKPGNFRVAIEVEPVNDGAPCTAFAYMKSRALADPIHSGYLASYQDRRFIPPEQRGSS
jgi:gamma-glutamylaminecyclotransferase